MTRQCPLIGRYDPTGDYHMMKKLFLPSNVNLLDHGIAVPCEHGGLVHPGWHVYLGLVPAPAAAGGCELRVPSCGGRCSPWTPQSSESAMARLNREPVVILAQERFQLLYTDTSSEPEPGKVSTQPGAWMTGARR